ncbi:MAG: chemotaxis protein CheW, partial [Desulfuromusa sp.]|nr:chemotaxis protein CheW [Desulfuromusa sp.]
LKGVVNLRGSIIPVMDVRLRFSMPERPYDDRTCLIVVRADGNTTGLVVDRVNEVSEIPVNQIEPAPRTGSDRGSYIKGMGKIADSVKILLDMTELLNDKTLAAPEEEVV